MWRTNHFYGSLFAATAGRNGSHDTTLRPNLLAANSIAGRTFSQKGLVLIERIAPLSRASSKRTGTASGRSKGLWTWDGTRKMLCWTDSDLLIYPRRVCWLK